MMTQQAKGSARIEQLRKSINSQDYMRSAIQRLAFVLSKRLVDITHGEGNYERQRKGGRF